MRRRAAVGAARAAAGNAAATTLLCSGRRIRRNALAKHLQKIRGGIITVPLVEACAFVCGAHCGRLESVAAAGRSQRGVLHRGPAVAAAAAEVRLGSGPRHSRSPVSVPPAPDQTGPRRMPDRAAPVTCRPQQMPATDSAPAHWRHCHCRGHLPAERGGGGEKVRPAVTCRRSGGGGQTVSAGRSLRVSQDPFPAHSFINNRHSTRRLWVTANVGPSDRLSGQHDTNCVTVSTLITCHNDTTQSCHIIFHRLSRDELCAKHEKDGALFHL